MLIGECKDDLPMKLARVRGQAGLNAGTSRLMSFARELSFTPLVDPEPALAVSM